MDQKLGVFTVHKKTRVHETNAAVHRVELEHVGRALFVARIDGVSLARSRDPLRAVSRRLLVAGLAAGVDEIVGLLAGKEITRSTIAREAYREPRTLTLGVAGAGARQRSSPRENSSHDQEPADFRPPRTARSGAAKVPCAVQKAGKFLEMRQITPKEAR